MKCTDCKEEKDQALTYKRCTRCGNWCPLEPQEVEKIKKRKEG